MTDEIAIRPEQIAVLRAQLKAANERLLSIERQREQMQTYIATLTDQLKRAENEDRSKTLILPIGCG